MNLKNKEKLMDKINNIDIFNPYILILFILLFVLIAIPMLYFSDELPSPSFQVYHCIIIGIIFFILGVNFPKILSKFSNGFKNKINTIKTIKEKKLTSFLFFNIKDYFKNKSKPNNSISDKFISDKFKFDSTKFGGCKFEEYKRGKYIELFILAIVLIGIILQIINFWILGGIPLFSGVLKAKVASKIWLFSYIFFIIGINLLLAKCNKKIYYLLLIIGLGFFALTGYRTTPIAILLSVFITLYYSRNMKIKYQIIFGVIILAILVVIGFIAMQSIEWQQWRLNALELVSYRVGFTLNVLDRTIPLPGSTHGELFYYTLTGFFESVDPRVIVGEFVLGKTHSITSTIFGPAILDFGWIGMVMQMFVIGTILKLLHFIQKHVKSVVSAFYGILLGQTVIWTETGPTDLSVWIFYLLGIGIIIYYFYNAEKYANNSSQYNVDEVVN
ncbi:hypothetical protein ALNOE001_17120 [Candidatus Methanobinarius endosymbioticus]|uniref:Oligosaccharide repeat unit polymerase n=1 Tax=Candidatus Methanobinarius endosymbioticus TaxID=2006182 RepID=A0A366M8T0_9EURY|nr:hypothetical protein ALNOE001_17120 [Candidatus Methanobinarius endosymbioticus]